ncbi:hypothetical protein [Flavisolibacter tropicus]|uniref:hypothetical protein n=1 Tax=Flavisolibacter tropicus TaxID=1492898 RepID=UPI001314FC27|nr:hypothetical protein [Flavisolibacter tropicus]
MQTKTLPNVEKKRTSSLTVELILQISRKKVDNIVFLLFYLPLGIVKAHCFL